MRHHQIFPEASTILGDCLSNPLSLLVCPRFPVPVLAFQTLSRLKALEVSLGFLQVLFV
uniref:Uncharacterized protein n=1 Tax=uncultured marine virus TaxID=186617 RepID=A0A0F7L0U8_9VIRU|nr:hypothetical protein [uncultured marine virus]